MIIELTKEEVDELIHTIHMTQDILAEAGDDLASAASEEDRQAGREYDKRNDLLDRLRKKLGDTWEPAPEYRVPDYVPEDL
jgi:hypothetical protein